MSKRIILGALRMRKRDAETAAAVSIQPDTRRNSFGVGAKTVPNGRLKFPDEGPPEGRGSSVFTKVRELSQLIVRLA